MPMSPLERKAAFKAAVTLKRTTMRGAAKHLGVHPNHLALVLAGSRAGSERLMRSIAEFIGQPFAKVWKERPKSAA